LVPEEGQGNPAVVLNVGVKAHQLRTLIPQKVTYPLMRLGVVETQGLHLLTKREITEMITIPMLSKV
jgi:hypothetical protein